MLIFFILFYHYCNTLNIFKKYEISEKSGMDERPIKTNDLIIEKIPEMIIKKKLLDFLESDKHNIFEKVDKINEFYGNNIPEPIDISKGGLFKDWDSE